MNSPIATEHRNRMAEFQRQHRTGLVTLVFTDLVDSVALRRQLGDQAGTSLLQAHRQVVRETLSRFTDAEEIETAGDSFLLLFARPSDAVKFALIVQMQTRALALTGRSNRRLPRRSLAETGQASAATALKARIGIHVGEVVIEEHERGPKLKDVYGTQIDLCARVMGLAEGGQILLTRGVFDSARQALKGEDIEGLNQLNGLNELQGGSQLQWLNYGPYLLKGIEESVEVCEVGETGIAPLKAPAGSEKAQRQVRADEEPVLGWRPALEQVVPNTKWVLEKKLGEGGFGEVWLGRHQTMKERRVFKFCFRADRVRSLKREMTLFRLIKERIGEHPHIVALREVYFDQPPFYVEMDYVEGNDLRPWCEARGGVEKVPLETRLEIVAQVADALQAAHAAGVIHRDVKPGNILVANPRSDSQTPKSVQTKLTDFGIGQVVSAEALAGMTRAGFTQTMMSPGSSSQTGTHLYMAPELLVGEPATTRSDIYSLGVVLFQLVAGGFNRPLTSEWMEDVADPLLREDIAECVSGKPQQRFANASELAKRLRALPQRRAEFDARQQALRRGRLARAAAVLILLAAIISGGAYLWLQRSRVQWAKNQVPEVERLRELAGLGWDYAKYRQALALAQKVSQHLPAEPRLQKAIAAVSRVLSIQSDPPGATVRIKPYDDQDANWTLLGQTPLKGIRLANGFFVVRFEKAGYEPVEAVRGGGTNTLSRKLDPANSIPSGMVRVSGTTNFSDFFIDKYEVTNRRYKEFVAAGGYRDRRYWKQEFIRDGKALTWEESMSVFRDGTGQPGPFTWVSGDYPPGREEHPVSGVSWYEAAAYAEFAGKSLPTIDHWAAAARLSSGEYIFGFPTLIARFSNFQESGPAPVGRYKGMNAFGAMDMSGNVREWCWNQSPSGRFLRGGAWDDAPYMYMNTGQQAAWDRSPRNGFRCATYLNRENIPATVFEPQGLNNPRDFAKEKPVPDSVFEIYKAKFQYDRTDLKAAIEERDESSPHWIHEKVTFDAAYDNERVIAHLYLPRNGRRPYQTVIYFPGSSAVGGAPSAGVNIAFLDYLVKNGRAVVYPIYKGTFERTGDMTIAKHGPSEEYRHAYTEFLAKWVKDFRRTVDYLETRTDFDPEKIAFLGHSWGGIIGTIIPAVELRIKANVLVLGGFIDNAAQPEAQGINYISRIKVPTLMLNGKYDMRFPLDSAVRPAFNLLGTPEKEKKLVLYDTDHYVPKRELMTESLAWLDRYLGPVK